MVDSSVLVALIVLSFCYIWFLYRKSEYKRRRDLINKIPGPKPWPIFGNANELLLWNSATKNFNILSIFFQVRVGLSKVYNEKKIMRLWVGRRPVVMIHGAETVEPLLKSNTLLDKGEFYKFLAPWLGEGLLLSKGDKWRRDRKLLTPTFHFRILDNFLIVMNEQAQILVDKIQEASEGKDWIDIHHLLSMCALDIICETAMGISIGAQDNSESEYVKSVKSFLEASATRGARPWMHRDFIFRLTKIGKTYYKAIEVLHSFTESVIKERLNETRQKRKEPINEEEQFGKKKLAFLDLLLQLGEGEFSASELREQVDTFMFAGHDTTSTALSWVFYLLGLYPKVQDQLLDEVDRVFQDDKDRHVTQDDMKQLKYMDMVMKESQRVYPAVPGFARRLTEDLQIGEFTVPQGTTVAVNTYIIHRDPKVYPDPEIFNPDRFSPENSVGRSPYAFIPFSAGARNCIGQRYALMEEKVVLSHVLRHFRVRSLDQRDKLILKPAAVMTTVGPLRVAFIRR